MTTRSVPKVSGGSSRCCISAGSDIGLAAADPLVVVGVGAVADEQLGEQVRQLGEAPPQLVGERRRVVGEDHLEHAEPLEPVEQRHPQHGGRPSPSVSSDLDRAEAAPGQRAVDRQPLAPARRSARPAGRARPARSRPATGRPRRRRGAARRARSARRSASGGMRCAAAQDRVERGGVRARRGPRSIRPCSHGPRTRRRSGAGGLG